MSADSNKVILVGSGKTGREVVRIIEENEIKGVAAFGIRKESELEKFTGEVTEEVELVLLVADLGSEKENSLALKAAAMIKKKGKVVAAILTTPPLFEGEKAIMRTLEVVREINVEADTSLIINKETFNTPPEKGCSFVELINSLISVEETIAGCIQNMMSLIAKSGAINTDLEDLKTVLAESGTFTIEIGLGAGENRVGNAIEQILSSPLMKKCDISTARKVLVKVLAPKNIPLIMTEMKVVSGFIETLPARVEVKWGVGESDDKDIVSVIILAAGFDVKLPE